MIVKRMALLVFTAAILGLMLPLLAQNNETILTIAIQEWQQDVFNDELFAEFAAEHPGVKIIPVLLPRDSYYGINTSDFEDTLKRATDLFSIADVLPVSTYQMSPEITRAGFVLDLTPLLASDSFADTEDFHSAALQSFQWEGATWALPVTTRLDLVIYDRGAFDEAGLAYPDGSWTLDDYINAGRALTVRDEAGKVTLPGIFGFDERILYRVMLGHGLYDTTTFPESPKLEDPELVTLFEMWQAYNDELLGDETDTSQLYQNLDYDAIPLRISGTWFLNQQQFGGGEQRDFQGALLPGDAAFVQAEGFAISAGTQNPELAYQFIQFLTRNAEVVNRMFGDAPARRSMANATSDSAVFTPAQFTPEVQALIDTGLENGLPASELRFFDYIFYARSQEDAPDTLTAMKEAQVQALDILAQAEAHKTTVALSIPTPVPTPILNGNEIALNFVFNPYVSPIPNREQWEAAIEAFVAEDAEVGQINLQTTYFSPEDLVEKTDCYVMASNIVPSAELNTLLPLDPLIATDPAFDEADILPGVMGQVQREGQTWALPISVMPSVIYYNTQLLTDAGAFEPTNGWSVSDFADTLRQLKAADSSTKPFTPLTFGNRYLLMLIAAYGGLPVQYDGTSTSYNLTDPATQEAIRQVTELVKEGLIDYRALDNNGGGGFGGAQYPMYDSFLSTDNWMMPVSPDMASAYQTVIYPRGSEYTPISYDLSVGAISAQTQYPEACYRWLSRVATTPELHSTMPVRRSLLTSPALEAAHGADRIAVYQTLADYLADPALLVFPGVSGGTGFETFILETWLNRSFDRIILEEADMVAELEQSQQFIDDYEVCIADVPRDAAWMTMSEDEIQAYFKQFTDCAVAVDPTLEGRWNFDS